MKSNLSYSSIISAFILLGSAAVSTASLAFKTIDLQAIGLGNASVGNIGPVTESNFPYGNPSDLGGVPFIITNEANQLWASAFAENGNWGTVSQTFPMSVEDIYGFYTIANTWWGADGGTFVTYTFNFDDETSYTLSLTNGIDLRDFNKGTTVWANTINGTTTKQVYDDPSTVYQLDRQWIDLAGAGYGGKNLESFTITDTGGDSISRIFLVAATAQVGQAGEAIPETSSAILTIIAFSFSIGRRRR